MRLASDTLQGEPDNLAQGRELDKSVGFALVVYRLRGKAPRAGPGDIIPAYELVVQKPGKLARPQDAVRRWAIAISNP